MSIRNIELNGQTLYFVADDLGTPVSFGYPTQEQAEQVAELIDSSEGLATIPDGVNIGQAMTLAQFQFATDSESGTITAASFDDACEKLDAMVADVDGAWGWVDDTNGDRYSIGDC